MMFNENSRVKIPALLHFTRLGYRYLSLKNTAWDARTNIFPAIFRTALQRINPAAPADEIDRTLQQVSLLLDNEDLGKAFHERLLATSGIRLIDFADFDNNSFHVVTELPCINDDEEFRPDITLLINGLPLAFIEVKKPNNRDGILAERNRIAARFQNPKFRRFVNITQLMMFSNNMEYDDTSSEPLQGAFYATASYTNPSFNFFREENASSLPALPPLDPADEDLILSDTNHHALKHSPEFATNCAPSTPTNRVTSSPEDNTKAHEQITQYNLPLKIHKGQLAEFFKIYNEVFDLIYFDACGPFIGGSKQSTLPPLLTILEKQRLAPKSALITNYSAPPDDGPARDRYIDLATAYFHPRYNDIPNVVRTSNLDPAEFALEPDLLKEFAAKNLEPIYSDLVTNLTIDLATNIVPNLRAFAMPAFLKQHANNQEALESLIARQTNQEVNDDGLPGDMRMSPSSYPILSFIDQLQIYAPNDPLICELKSYNHQGLSFKHFISVSELMKGVVEGNWSVLSPELLAALKCSWFDYNLRLTCDIPLPNLLINAIIGTYGRPYFYNPRQSMRVKYKSNVRDMYCDLFIFDQCRSFFDWFPTVQACPSRFKSVPFQIVARCIIDRLSWANYYNTANPFNGAAIEAMGTIPSARPLIIPERILIE